MKSEYVEKRFSPLLMILLFSFMALLSSQMTWAARINEEGSNGGADFCEKSCHPHASTADANDYAPHLAQQRAAMLNNGGTPIDRNGEDSDATSAQLAPQPSSKKRILTVSK